VTAGASSGRAEEEVKQIIAEGYEIFFNIS
jgi:hypothetical protein